MDFRLLRSVQPYDDESLISFLIRLAQSNFCPAPWLIYRLKSYSTAKISFIPYSINYIIDKNIITPLVQMTGFTEDRIIDLTLNKYAKDPWALDIGDIVKFPSGKNNGFMNKGRSKYCPQCLKELQYHRLYWQLEQIIICHKHEVILLQKCFNCGKVLTPVQIALGICNCGQSLSDIETDPVTKQQVIENQNRVYNLYEIKETEKSSPIMYFDINKSDYIYFLRFINYFVGKTSKSLTEIERTEKVEQIIRDWPNTFDTTLYSVFLSEYLSDQQMQKNNRGLWSVLRKPLCDLRIENSAIERIGFLREELFQISTVLYSENILREKFQNRILNNNLISVEDLRLYFGFDVKLLKQLFNMRIHDKYCEFERIINFFIDIINNSSKGYLEGSCTQVINIYKELVNKGITITDVLNVISKREVGYFINPLNNGLKMIIAPEGKVRPLLLKIIEGRRESKIL